MKGRTAAGTFGVEIHVRIRGAAVTFGLALSLAACGTPPQRPVAPAAATPTPAASATTVAPTAVPTVAPTALPTVATGTPAGEVLTVTPQAGPIGTLVTVRGQGCGNPAAPATAHLYFGSDGEPGLTGTVGAADIGDVAVDSAGQMRVTFTIPAAIHSLQGLGGGPVRPGTYEFATTPPMCVAKFVVLPG
jgi:hypothetical protein